MYKINPFSQDYYPDNWSSMDHSRCTSNTTYHDQLGDTPIAIPVPTLVLMLDRASPCHGGGNNDIYLRHEVCVQISPQISRMKPGEHTDYEGLFDPFVLDITPQWTHRDILSPIVSELAAQGKVPLEVVGFSSECRELYRRI